MRHALVALVATLLIAPSALAEVTVKVATPPPALKVEAQPAQPAGATVWAPGHWQRAGNDWVWVSGKWMKPHKTHKHYVGARWVKKAGVYVYKPGGWAKKKGGRVLVVGDHKPGKKSSQRLNREARAHDKRADNQDAKAERLDARADRAEANGREQKSDRLERKADRAERKADRAERKAQRKRSRAKRR